MSDHSATKVESLIRTLPELGEKQRLVLNTIRSFHPITRTKIAEVSQLRLSSVCGRVNELMKLNLVREEGTAYDSQSRRNLALLVPVTDINQTEMSF